MLRNTAGGNGRGGGKGGSAGTHSGGGGAWKAQDPPAALHRQQPPPIMLPPPLCPLRTPQLPPQRFQDPSPRPPPPLRIPSRPPQPLPNAPLSHLRPPNTSAFPPDLHFPPPTPPPRLGTPPNAPITPYAPPSRGPKRPSGPPAVPPHLPPPGRSPRALPGRRRRFADGRQRLTGLLPLGVLMRGALQAALPGSSGRYRVLRGPAERNGQARSSPATPRPPARPRSPLGRTLVPEIGGHGGGPAFPKWRQRPLRHFPLRLPASTSGMRFR